MTEIEKKAEEYSNTTYTDWCSDNGYPDCNKECIKCVRKQSYTDGCEDGQKIICKEIIEELEQLHHNSKFGITVYDAINIVKRIGDIR